MDMVTTQPGIFPFPSVKAAAVLFFLKKDPPKMVIPIRYRKKTAKSIPFIYS
jgi:hypothetical protein